MPVTTQELKESFKLSIHTNYYNSFFLLRTAVVINGEQAVVEVDEDGWLTLKSRYPEVAVTFDSLVTDVNDILQRNGMAATTNYWCEEAPLFEVKVSSKENLKQLLRLEVKIKEELALKIATRMTAQLESPDASVSFPHLHALVQPQVYLMVCDRNVKRDELIRVTTTNLGYCMGLFAESNIFNFGDLFRKYRANPSGTDKGIKPVTICFYQNNFAYIFSFQQVQRNWQN